MAGFGTKLHISAFIAAALAAATLFAVPVKISDLSPNAAAFLNSHLPEGRIVSVADDGSFFFPDCIVELSDSTRVRFDFDGQWRSVENSKTGIALKSVPPHIREAFETRFIGAKIRSMQKRRNGGIEVVLFDGRIFRFYENGECIDFTPEGGG